MATVIKIKITFGGTKRVYPFLLLLLFNPYLVYCTTKYIKLHWRARFVVSCGHAGGLCSGYYQSTGRPRPSPVFVPDFVIIRSDEIRIMRLRNENIDSGFGFPTMNTMATKYELIPTQWVFHITRSRGRQEKSVLRRETISLHRIKTIIWFRLGFYYGKCFVGQKMCWMKVRHSIVGVTPYYYCYYKHPSRV